MLVGIAPVGIGTCTQVQQHATEFLSGCYGLVNKSVSEIQMEGTVIENRNGFIFTTNVLSSSNNQ